MVRGGDADDVDIAVFHQPAQVALKRRPLPVLAAGDRVDGALGSGGIDIANVRHDAVVPAGKAANVVGAAAADADDGHVQAVPTSGGLGLDGLGCGGEQIRAGRRGGEEGGSFEELTPTE